MVQTDNLNIESAVPLSVPAAIRAELPLTARAADTVVAARAEIENILTRRSARHLLLVGPCSIHSPAGALEYATRLAALHRAVADRLLLVMRVYFEKPRTTLGWKGLIYDPDLDGACNLEKGLRRAREILLAVNELGVPAATEILEPVLPQYITDLVAWAAIGARTAESQTHRQMASGLSMPAGFKNATDGSLQVAVEAIKTAASPHAFLGLTTDGCVGVFRTRGNAFGHLVLRGGNGGPNYGSEYVLFAAELMRKAGIAANVVVDCSHGNSQKRAELQGAVLREVMAQRQAHGSDRIVIGTMLESYLLAGRQDLADGPGPMLPGLSVTDACIGWEETEALIREMYASLS